MPPHPGLVLRTRYLVLLVEEVTPAGVLLAYLDPAGMPRPFPVVGIRAEDWSILAAEAALCDALDA